MANNKCKDCGCACNKCALNHDVHLHVEIENLKQRLVERDNHIVTMETTFLNEADKFPNGEFVALREEILTWQDKYSRLYESHKRVQKVNQSLEDKLLKLVDKSETEKTALTKDVATLSHRLADANYNIQRLQDDNEKYKNDVNLAIQLLQCKPGNFVSHRLDSLPNEVQAKVSSYVASRRKPPEDRKAPEVRSIKVPIPTFPPTAMVYSIPKTPSPENDSSSFNDNDKPQVDLVSAAIMAKILEEREKERSFTKHCDSCTCSKHCFPTATHHTVATQTGEKKNSLCLKCNCELDRSPLGSMKIMKIDAKMVPISHKTKIYPHNASYSEINERNSLKNKIAVSENSKIVEAAISDSFVKSNSTMLIDPKSGASIDPKSGHHRLCHENLPETETEEKKNSKSTENLKGPRFCSMRMQSGSKNILLDNVHGNYAPVLYTRQLSKELKESKESNEKKKQNCDKTFGSSSSDERKSLVLSECDNSYHKQQRVAEWVQNIDETEVEASGSEHSKKNEIIDFDAQQYAQIETNVKNFLFKSDLLNAESDTKAIKKLTNIKQKYQHVDKNLPTETEI